MPKPTFYITTPIYYPSSDLHIGHAYTTVAADAIARYKRLRGYDTFFVTGTDEHGQKIERKARALGKEPREFVDEIVEGIKRLWAALHISYDDFIRTTEDRHKKVVQALFDRIRDQGDIYKAEYEGWYCVPCETFWLERQMVDGKCPNPDCGRPVEWVREESYFFRLSKYQDRLLRHIEENPDFIQPVSRRNEMINFIKQGLEDLCVSRTTFKWGIPVPGDEGHVIYVWFDALTNYITAAGYLTDPEKFERYWPADVHLVGKEIVRFHTIIWPIILMAAGVELPKKVFGHGWLIFEGGKMSKSKGNVVEPVTLIKKYGVDAVRYFLLREVAFGSDGFYSEEALVSRINSDLANDLGNLLHRTLAVLHRFFDGRIPAALEESYVDGEIRELAQQVITEYTECLDRLEISNALAAVWKLVGKCNKYLDERAPWNLAHTAPEQAGTVLRYVLESLRLTAALLVPFLVETPERIWYQLGLPGSPRDLSWEDITWGGLPEGTLTQKGEPIFPRIETEPKPPETRPGGKERSDMISIDEFGKVDLRVARVISAENIPGADRILKLEVDLGYEKRTIVAGIAQHYKPQELVGRQVVIVANLKPATIKGIQSQGMVLAAEDGDRLSLLTVTEEIPDGSRVK